jgi:hypothetical protein
VICMFLDGPIAGDVRTDMPALQTLRVPIPRRITYCDCNPDHDDIIEQMPEIADYRVIVSGPRVAIYSCEPNASDKRLVDMLKNWMVSDLGNPLWERHCRDRRAFV